MNKVLKKLGLVAGFMAVSGGVVLVPAQPVAARSLSVSANCSVSQNIPNPPTPVAAADVITLNQQTGSCLYLSVEKSLVGGSSDIVPTFSSGTSSIRDGGTYWDVTAPTGETITSVQITVGGSVVGQINYNGGSANGYVGMFWNVNSSGGGGGSSSSSSSSSPAKLVKVDLDPAGGTCLVDGRSTAARVELMAVGYLYVPGRSECQRPGYSLAGWANQSDPSTKLSLPLLSTDGHRRYFVADSLDLVAVWEPTSYVVNLETLANFLCEDCDSVLLVWSVEPDLSGDVTVEIDGVVTQCGLEGALANLSYCWITGLTTGEHSAAVSVESGTMSARSTARSFVLS